MIKASAYTGELGHGWWENANLTCTARDSERRDPCQSLPKLSVSPLNVLMFGYEEPPVAVAVMANPFHHSGATKGTVCPQAITKLLFV